LALMGTPRRPDDADRRLANLGVRSGPLTLDAWPGDQTIGPCGSINEGSEDLTTPECHRLLAVAAKKGPPARRETAGVSALYKCSRQGICIPNIAVGADLAPSNPVHLDLRRAPRK
jgi:hypothetical protein